METALRIGSLALLLAALAVGAYVWAVPVDVAQSWALQDAPEDALARFEAVGRREAVWWSLRVAALVVALAASAALLRTRPLARRVRVVWACLVCVTRVESPVSSLALRVLVVGWVCLAVSQGAHALRQRIDDWPVYRLRSGPEILPNISQSNREVIRYLQAATPPDAKILVLSDQKLFFIAYYLRPRRLFHPMHPDSEFVIPLPHGARPAPAYRLDDLPEDYLRELDPDFILEYYEGPAYADAGRFDEDPIWLGFQRMRYGSDHRPDYLVVLRNLRKRPLP